MPTIRIKTDRLTPNFCALEAVSAWMMSNLTERQYRAERVFDVKSGRRLKVKELAQRKGDSVCSCSFSVTVLAKIGGEGVSG